jgi:two-component system nitrate/nitrite response regulator NarL
MPDRIRIAVIDDHPLFREGVVHTLLHAHDMAVVGEGASAADAVRIAISDLPDIILLDVSMPGGGIEAAREIRKSCAFVKTVILTASENERHVADALQSGVTGYILKAAAAPNCCRSFALFRTRNYISRQPSRPGFWGKRSSPPPIHAARSMLIA